MNSIRYSNIAALFVALLVVAGAATPAAAVSASEETLPEEAQVEQQVNGEFTITDLYKEHSTWTLVGQSELKQATWQVSLYNQAGEQVGSETYSGQEFKQGIDIDSGVDEVRVRIDGTVPAVENYSYDPAQTFAMADFKQQLQGGSVNEIKSFEVHHYTEDSKKAYNAIASAEESMNDADAQGAGVGEMNQSLQAAVSSYENENFQNAIEIASNVESDASSSWLLFVALKGIGGLLLFAGVVGGVFWYRNQDDYDKLG